MVDEVAPRAVLLHQHLGRAHLGGDAPAARARDRVLPVGDGHDVRVPERARLAHFFLDHPASGGLWALEGDRPTRRLQMTSRSRLRLLVVLAALALAAPPASADPAKCQKTLLTGLRKYKKTYLKKAWEKCL